MRGWLDRSELIEELNKLIKETSENVDLLLVEGTRDVSALRDLGYNGPLEICSHIGVRNTDLATNIGAKAKRVLILTDFDSEGNRMASRLSSLLLGESVSVNIPLRKRFSRLLGALGLRTIESINGLTKL